MKLLNIFMSRLVNHPILSCNEYFKIFLTAKQTVIYSFYVYLVGFVGFFYVVSWFLGVFELSQVEKFDSEDFEFVAEFSGRLFD